MLLKQQCAAKAGAGRLGAVGGRYKASLAQQRRTCRNLSISAVGKSPDIAGLATMRLRAREPGSASSGSP